MKYKILTLSTAAAALFASGALAQDNTNQNTGQQGTPPAVEQPTTPPAVTEPATPPAVSSDQPVAGESAVVKDLEMTKPSADYVSTMSAGEMLASKLIGLSVTNPAGEELGDINDLVVDQSGKPVVAIIGVGGFLGMGEKNVGVPFDRLEITMNEDKERVARIDATKKTLEAAPGFVISEKQAALTNN